MAGVDVFKWELVRLHTEAPPRALRATTIVDDAPGVLVTVTIRPHEGGWVVDGISIDNDPAYWVDRGEQPQDPDFQKTLRAIKPATVVRAVVAQLTYQGVDPDVADFLHEQYDATTRSLLAAAPVPDTPRRGRKPVDSDTVRRWAEATLELNADGEGKIHARLAERFVENEAKARDMIRRSRERGFLMPTERGRPDFQPGPALLAVWEQFGYPSWHLNHGVEASASSTAGHKRRGNRDEHQ